MAGSSNVTGLESILFADNMSFDGTQRGGAMTTDGQLWIGSTAAPHVKKGTLTAGTGISITNGSGSITISQSGSSSGNFSLIQSQTAAGATELNFTTGLTGFDVYFIQFYDALVNSSNSSFLIQYSVNGGSTYVTTGYTTQSTYSFGGAAQANTATLLPGSVFVLSSSGTTDPLSSANGIVYLYGFSSSTLYKSTNAICNTNSIVPAFFQEAHASTNTTTAVINAIKILTSTGDTFTGKFKLYGIIN